MPRIVSVWFPRWPIVRFLAERTRNASRRQADNAQPTAKDNRQPLVLAVEVSGGARIAALNAAAENVGLSVGERVADARARVDWLQVHAADPAADDAALRQLALWATRYTPAVSLWGEQNGADGFFLDVIGAAHLFDGEEKLLADLSQRLNCFGLPARLAIADTPGAAWALSRFHGSRMCLLPSDQTTKALESLPVTALRLSPDTRTTLHRLGFKRIGDLVDKPRAPFASRFEAELLTRLDQMFGRRTEPMEFVVALPVYHSIRYLLEPVVTQDAVVSITTRLMKDLVHALVRDGVGVRTLRLSLYRVDGHVPTIDIGLTKPSRDPAHIAKLVDLKLERINETVEAGFGFEALGLAAVIVEPMEPQQTDIDPDCDHDRTERFSVLVDSFKQRLGPRSIRQLKPLESYLPERAEAAHPAAAEENSWPARDSTRLRPIFLLPRAEPVEVTFLVPEGPPQRFRWRGTMYHVTYAEGPERIAGEWWRDGLQQPSRDYYLVEDRNGHRFWLYRKGVLARETNTSQWFVHGLFA
jgi:protein ImuB